MLVRGPGSRDGCAVEMAPSRTLPADAVLGSGRPLVLDVPLVPEMVPVPVAVPVAAEVGALVVGGVPAVGRVPVAGGGLVGAAAGPRAGAGAVAAPVAAATLGLFVGGVVGDRVGTGRAGSGIEVCGLPGVGAGVPASRVSAALVVAVALEAGDVVPVRGAVVAESLTVAFVEVVAEAVAMAVVGDAERRGDAAAVGVASAERASRGAGDRAGPVGIGAADSVGVGVAHRADVDPGGVAGFPEVTDRLGAASTVGLAAALWGVAQPDAVSRPKAVAVPVGRAAGGAKPAVTRAPPFEAGSAVRVSSRDPVGRGGSAADGLAGRVSSGEGGDGSGRGDVPVGRDADEGRTPSRAVVEDGAKGADGVGTGKAALVGVGPAGAGAVGAGPAGCSRAVRRSYDVRSSAVRDGVPARRGPTSMTTRSWVSGWTGTTTTVGCSTSSVGVGAVVCGSVVRSDRAASGGLAASGPSPAWTTSSAGRETPRVARSPEGAAEDSVAYRSCDDARPSRSAPKGWAESGRDGAQVGLSVGIRALRAALSGPGRLGGVEAPGVGGAELVTWAVGVVPGASGGAGKVVAGGSGLRLGCGIGAGVGTYGVGGALVCTGTRPSAVATGTGAAMVPSEAGTGTVFSGALGRPAGASAVSGTGAPAARVPDSMAARAIRSPGAASRVVATARGAGVAGAA